MKNILIGNGFNIEFDKTNYTSTNIIKRGVENIKMKTSNSELYEIASKILDTCKNYCNKIFAIKNSIFKIYPWEVDEINDIKSFYVRYSKFEEIGFEDLFLVLHIMFHLERINANEREAIIEHLRFFLLDSIYNGGHINLLHKRYSEKLIVFLKEQDNIFTTNYDENLDQVCDKKIIHLHGCFRDVLEKYNNNSSMNKAMGISSKMNEQNKHIFSTSLSSFSGIQKTKMISQPLMVNKGLPLLVKIKEKYGNIKVALLNKIEKAYEKNQDYVYPDSYYFDDFKHMIGELIIIGLSPNNDTHIFDTIKNNKKINKILYFYYNHKDRDEAIKIFGNDTKIVYKDVELKFWESYK